MRKAFLLAGAALALAAGAAQADPLLGLYVGAGAIHSNIDHVLDTNLDINDEEYKVFAGIRPAGSPLGFEAEYLDLGSRSNGVVRAKSNAWAYEALLPIPLPLPLVSLFAKAGLAQDEVRGSLAERALIVSRDEQASQFTYGAGVQLNLGSAGARLEYQHFPLISTSGANVVTIGVQFTFL